jgi:hypothetical protein
MCYEYSKKGDAKKAKKGDGFIILIHGHKEAIMTIWLIRAGSHGEYEQKFIQENRCDLPGKIDMCNWQGGQESA